MALIGWSRPAESGDAGVPQDVANVLGRTVTSVARVTFLASEKPLTAASARPPRDGDQIWPVTAGGIAGRLGARIRGLPSNAVFVSTRHPGTAAQLFNDAGFPWWLQGQVALLTRPEAPPPGVEARTIVELFEPNWTTHTASLAAAEVVAVLRPGVDGDVAGLLSLTERFEETAFDALEREALSAGFAWRLVSESHFGGG
jgi:hypothetical protein